MSRKSSKILLVEGKDDLHVLAHLLQETGFPEVFTLRDLNGYESLIEEIPTALKSPGLSHIGLIIDADTDLDRRWQSVCGQLRQSVTIELPDTPNPGGTIAITGDGIRVGIWVMPDNKVPGMLEDFYQLLIAPNDRLIDRARAAVAAIPDAERPFKPVHESKAVIHTWLAWQEDPGTPLGLAITKRYVSTSHPGVDTLLTWLRSLFNDDIATVEPALAEAL